MGAHRLGRGLLSLRAALFLTPLLLPHLVAVERLPSGVAYLVTQGRWLLWTGAAAAWIHLARGPDVSSRWRWPRWEGSRSRHGAWVAGLLAAFFFFASIPGYRRSGEALSGDEPKYLALAESLYRDLDVDVASTSQEPLGSSHFRANLRALGRSTVAGLESLLGLGDPVTGKARPLGNWAIAGRKGGVFLVQSPGLAAVLLPAIAIQQGIGFEDPLLPLFATLALLWAAGLVQTALLAGDVSGSPLAGTVAALALFVSAPLYVGGFHFYPEVVAVAVVPWLLRILRRPARGRLATFASALLAGSLPWLHPKFLLLSAALVVLVAWRRPRGEKVLALLGAGLPLAALLLYDYTVTGRLRPDAFYVTYASSVYSGPSDFLSLKIASGLVNGLFAARDGLLVMAPIAIAGLLVVPLAWRKAPAAVGVAVALGASVWLAAALHDGGAPGPPGRLMTTAAALLAVPLAVGLVELRGWLVYRWSVVALLLISLAITSALRADWRRIVNPYRGLVAEGARLGRDLPDALLDPGQRPAPWRRAADLARGAILGGTLAAWAVVLVRTRRGPRPSEGWPALLAFHAAWWGTILFLSTALALVTRVSQSRQTATSPWRVEERDSRRSSSGKTLVARRWAIRLMASFSSSVKSE